MKYTDPNWNPIPAPGSLATILKTKTSHDRPVIVDSVIGDRVHFHNAVSQRRGTMLYTAWRRPGVVRVDSARPTGSPNSERAPDALTRIADSLEAFLVIIRTEILRKEDARIGDTR